MYILRGVNHVTTKYRKRKTYKRSPEAIALSQQLNAIKRKLGQQGYKVRCNPNRRDQWRVLDKNDLLVCCIWQNYQKIWQVSQCNIPGNRPVIESLINEAVRVAAPEEHRQ
jgi:hypothetical protein